MIHEDVYIHYAQIPGGVKEAVCRCPGGYSIIIDPRQSSAGIRRSYEHAMRHIKNGDFEKFDVQRIECEAHR